MTAVPGRPPVVMPLWQWNDQQAKTASFWQTRAAEHIERARAARLAGVLAAAATALDAAERCLDQADRAQDLIRGP